MQYISVILLIIIVIFFASGKQEFETNFGKVDFPEIVIYFAIFNFIIAIFEVIKNQKRFNEFKKKRGHYNIDRGILTQEEVKIKELNLRKEFRKEELERTKHGFDRIMRSIFSFFVFLMIFYALIYEFTGRNIFKELLNLLGY